jgi:hypothetical protein
MQTATQFTLWPRPHSQLITAEYLRAHPRDIFVFGDNTEHRGHGGAAVLRDLPNVYGFITKRLPVRGDQGYYTPEEYGPIYTTEMAKLQECLRRYYDRRFLISKLGGGLANRFGIWEAVIKPQIKRDLQPFGDQVIFLWEIPLR